jgi:DNA-binding transcriptional ArsR family regulator
VTRSEVAELLREVVALYEAVIHPLRVRILVDIAEHGPTSPTEMTERLPASLGTIAYHVRWLNGRGLIVVASTERRRGATETFWRVPDGVMFGWALLELGGAELP